MRIIKYLILLLAGVLLYLPASSQQRVINGYVLAFDGYPVQNILLSSKKAGSQALSDSIGFFQIVCETKDVIKIKSETFESEKIKITGPRDTLRILLRFVHTPRNITKAVELGYMESEMLSSALQESTNRSNNYCNYTTFQDLMKYEFPNLAAGIPGGAKSFNMEVTPVYVVDGVQVPSADYLIPCDLVSVTVVKDGSAAIYGSRGAGGVVMIKTKRGNQ